MAPVVIVERNPTPYAVREGDLQPSLRLLGKGKKNSEFPASAI
jgi:hypothetical protein